MNNNINKVDIKEKKKHKFNIVDFFILLLVVAIIGTAIYAVFSWSDIKALWSTSSKKIEYIIELRGVDDEFINNIKENDTVIDSVSKNQLGKVKSVNSNEHYSVLNYEVDEKNGGGYKGVLVKDESKYNISVYVSATAEYEKGVGYTVNGTRIAVGEALELRFPQFSSTTAYCVHIDETLE